LAPVGAGAAKPAFADASRNRRLPCGNRYPFEVRTSTAELTALAALANCD